MLARSSPRAASAVISGLLALVCSTLSSGCSTYKAGGNVDLSAEYWLAELQGKIQSPVPGVPLDSFDIKDDLHVDTTEGIPVYQAAVTLGPAQLELRYFDLYFEGSGVLTQDITFGGQVFNLSTQVETDILLAEAAGFLKFPVLGTAYLATGPIVGGEYVDLETRLQAIPPPASLKVTDKIDVLLPVFGWTIGSGVPLAENFSLFVEADAVGFTGSYREVDGTFLDLWGKGGVELYQNFRLGVGYRYFETNFGSNTNDEIDVKLDGVLFFGEVIF